MGPLLERLSAVYGVQPAGHPGLYRQLNQAYFQRVAAIEYTMAHDDGKNPEDWPQADVLILGVSRCGKTPLSLYLSVLGWRAANYPLVSGLEPPGVLMAVDPGRVVGLDIDAWQLLQHRQRRQSQLGAPGQSAYTNPEAIETELEEARRLFRRLGCAVIRVTDKPVESAADEVIRLLSRRY
jgi:regulator of PEP synthase PpsR (kinase-PPPase family)